MSQIEEFKNYFNEILSEIKPDILVKKAVSFENDSLKINGQEIALPKNKKIHLFGSGKAVVSMAKAMFELTEEKIASAILVGPYENTLSNEKINYIKSTHPLPSDKSVKAAKALISGLKSLKEDDFYIYLLSGGNSALVEKPVEGISLKQFQETTDLMLKGALPIEGINCIRKHLSQVKGGRLATYTKAKGVVLVLSDVLGDDLEAIGSAPLYLDKTTFQDAVDYLKEYELINKVPQEVKSYLEKGAKNLYEDTPSSSKKDIQHFLVGSNDIFLKTAESFLDKKALNPVLIEEKINHNVDEVLKKVLKLIEQNDKACFLLGGEATVKVEGNGKGGRNQHLVLSFLKKLSSFNKKVTFLSGASDGVDGNSSAAGAIVDNSSLQKAVDKNLEIEKYLKEFDSNSFFAKLDLLLNPGPTHNNMLDIIIIKID